MHQKVRKSSVILRVSALILGCLFVAAAVAAQEKAPKVETSNQPQAISTVGTATTVESGTGVPLVNHAQDARATNNLSNDYKKSLNDLAALFERQVRKLEQQNTQIKGLYRDGLVSRVEVEKSDKELVDARAKVEEARNQIAEANKPVPVVTAASSNPVLSNAVWTTGNSRVDNLVRFYGNKYGVDPYLIFCLMHQESRFSNNATSYKGAQGLMQLMPGTAARYGVTNPYDVAQSIMGGTRYLKDLLQMFNGRVDLALAGYNAGENAVIKYGYNIPPYSETRNYVRLITSRYAMKPAS
jgi:soluble lytic murein transglycosylase-like protein